MRLKFRQGIVRRQTDVTNNPTFLIPSTSGEEITLNVSPDPTIITFAHGEHTDYLFSESLTINDAWTNLVSGNDYWLYWDLNPLTGERTFGQTTLEPITSITEPPSPALDQHWFDLSTNTMKVWKGPRFVDTIRVFAAKYDNASVLVHYALGSQVGVADNITAGYLLFDDEDKPVKKFDRFGRGKFITTESPLASQFTRLASFKLEAEVITAEAVENIPQWYCIRLDGNQKMRLATYTDQDFPCVGVANEDIFISETRAFVRAGYMTDENWNWTSAPGSPIFVGLNGEITTDVPQTGSIQQIGNIVSPTRILVDIRQQIILDET